MNKIFIKISIFLLAIILLIFVYSFITRISNDNSSTIIEDKQEFQTIEKAIQINILNSTNHNGIADLARNYLRDKGFDVVEIGNYNTNLKKSIVIDRIGDLNSSKITAKAIGINDSLIKTMIDSSLFISSSIILGEDYLSLPAFKKQP